MRTFNSLRSYLMRHTPLILAFLLLTCLILCPVIIGSYMGHYAEKSDTFYKNQEAIQSYQRSIQNLLIIQNSLLKDTETQMINMRIDIEKFRKRLKDDIIDYFNIQNKDRKPND